MAVMDVRRRSTLAGPVEELRHRELVGIERQCRAAAILALCRADRLAFLHLPTRRMMTSPGSPVAYSGGGCWSKAAAEPRTKSPNPEPGRG